MENKIKAKIGKRIKLPELEYALHEVEIKFWPNHKRRGRRPANG